MDIDNFATDLKYLSTNGVTLNVEERLNVQLAFKTLSKEIPFEKIQFWGKIEGKFKFWLKKPCFFFITYKI